MEEKNINNYHTHTYRCGHAKGTDEDFVKTAIEMGIKVLGFSDHVCLPGVSSPEIRQDVSMIEDYVSSINALKEKYKDQIEIHVGYEAEYMKEYLPHYRDLLKNKGIEYLICGQHCIIVDGKEDFYGKHLHDARSVSQYIDSLIDACRCGLYSYIAHPDWFMNGYREWNEFTINESKRFLQVCKVYDMPLEINVNGLRYQWYKHRKNPIGKVSEAYYPYDEFWKLVGEYGIKTIIGIDAHRVEDMTDGEEKEAFELVKKYNLNLINTLNFKKIK